MPRIAYFDCPTGIAGDMCLGALVHSGVPLPYLQGQLAKLGIKQAFQLSSRSVRRNHQAGTKVEVQVIGDGADLPLGGAGASDFADEHRHAGGQGAPPHQRHLPEIERLIRQAQLPERVEAWSLAVFRNLAIAEGKVHGIDPQQVHFHEVGAVDALVDIVGTCVGLDYLQIERIYCSPLPVGGGSVWAAHGRLPVPAPAVLQLCAMGQIPLYSNGIERELVTPTGAAIALTLSEAFGPPPPLRLHSVGLGAGSLELPLPNLLRLWIGEADDSQQGRGQRREHAQEYNRGAVLRRLGPMEPGPMDLSEGGASEEPGTQAQTGSQGEGQTEGQVEGQAESGMQGERGEREGATDSLLLEGQGDRPADQTPTAIMLLQTQLDDLSPQAIGYAFERLLAAGALDVFTQAIAMKKNRPGVLLSVICANDAVEAIEAILFAETTTLGIRRQPQQRRILHRRWQPVTTPYGQVRIKLGYSSQGQLLNVQPEYEDCAALAAREARPWREIHQAAIQAWQGALG